MKTDILMLLEYQDNPDNGKQTSILLISFKQPLIGFWYFFLMIPTLFTLIERVN